MNKVYTLLLSDLYLDAIKNKEKKLSLIHGESFSDILKIASSRWVEYIPEKRDTYSVGIDSSWNKKSYQGIDLFVIDSVAVTSFNQILSTRWNYGVNTVSGGSLSSEAMIMEIDLSSLVMVDMDEKPDILCVDGSIISNMLHNKSSRYANKVQSLIQKNNRDSLILFISKNSNTKNQFKEHGAKAADIYYFNKLGSNPGFSLPNINTNPNLSGVLDVVEVYVRLSPFVPLIKIEIINNLSISEKEIQNIMDRLCYHSINGYPYCLRLAHKSCKVANVDVKRIASVYGLKNEFGARDSLNE